MTSKPGRLRIIAERGGTITEITEFLSDLESAYIALHSFDQRWPPTRLSRRFPTELLMDLGYPLWEIGELRRTPISIDAVHPSARLVLEHVRIESPGFWEFLASLNPLQQIREYLNDRHRRRQDRDFREVSEKQRLELENELIKLQIEEKRNSILREKIAILREAGYSRDDIDRLIWSSIGVPLARLGRHQDSGLIKGAE